MSYIEFREGPPHPKTRVWVVVATENENLLGVVKWFGQWRCYAFFPEIQTVFEKKCLRDIADFCELQTNEQRKRRELK